MQPALEGTVLGNFTNASFKNGGVTSTFFRRDGKYFVHSDGQDGAMHDYEMKFTFGVYPLQQYLIELPGGRLQAFGIGWDSRPRAQGGQRWFALYPSPSTTPDDSLHWTAIDQNWNYMCADCHSTNVRKNYDLGHRSYSTTYSEIDVACEACHGPGSNHLAWARKEADWKNLNAQGLTNPLDDRKGAAWITDQASGHPYRSKPRTSEREIQTCARCHSHRAQLHEDYLHGQSVDDDYQVALLEENLYFPDGQIKAEDYEYGSFVQSRMYNAGVTCSDCHDPHSAKLRAEGNDLCVRCHLAKKYDSPAHHFHKAASEGAKCVNCHMPSRIYMIIDARRDHSIRIPRPDLSVTLGTPNACNDCHTRQTATWASERIQKWYGHAPTGFQHFATTLNAGNEGAPGASRLLHTLVDDSGQPAIARATAMSLIANYGLTPADAALRKSITDDSPLVRRAAAHAASEVEAPGFSDAIGPLLKDPIRSVRMETAYALAGPPAKSLSPNMLSAFSLARDEYVAAQHLNDDRPESHLNLASLFERENDPASAEAELKTALSLDPSFAPGAVNLADLDRALGHEAEGEAVLRRALARLPREASLLHALGLSKVRQQQHATALELFAAAVRSNPKVARYSYVYAVALNDAGHTDKAIAVLERSLELHPYDRDSLSALAIFLQKSGKNSEAAAITRRLEQLADQ